MRLSDLILEKLVALVQEQGLQAGDRLPSERSLASQFGVSRPAIREAIRTLASRQWLTTKHGGGSYVTEQFHHSHQALDPSASSYQQHIIEARQIIEASTAWHAALRATDEDKQRLKQCLDAIEALQQTAQHQQAAIADAHFHLAIAEASHNVVFVQIMRGFFQHLLSNVEKNRQSALHESSCFASDQLTLQHRALLDAILQGDAQQAQAAAIHHLDYVHQRLTHRHTNTVR